MSTDEGVRLDKARDSEAPDAGVEGLVEAAPGRRGGTRRRAKREAEPAASEVPVDDQLDSEPDDRSVVEADPRFWHRAHPVFTPLSGFFTGVAVILAVLAALGWLLEEVVEYDVTDHPWVFLVAIGAVFLVNLALVAVPRTRRFARYMLFGVLATPLVVAGVAALTSYVLLKNDG